MLNTLLIFIFAELIDCEQRRWVDDAPPLVAALADNKGQAETYIDHVRAAFNSNTTKLMIGKFGAVSGYSQGGGSQLRATINGTCYRIFVAGISFAQEQISALENGIRALWNNYITLTTSTGTPPLYKGYKKKAKEAEHQRLEQERRSNEEAERQRLEQERRANEEADRQRLEQERRANEEADRQRLEQERRANEEAERQRLEKQQKAKEAEAETERLRLEKEQKAKLQSAKALAEQHISTLTRFGKGGKKALQDAIKNAQTVTQLIANFNTILSQWNNGSPLLSMGGAAACAKNGSA